MQKKQRFAGIKLVPVSINGLTVPINLAAIDKNARTVHHGEFEGKKVNSPATLKIGDSVAIWADTDKQPAITMSQPAMGLMCQQYLESEGYAVSKKS
ncbi:hypothetical protein D4R49_00735 [bacterium]|nr:MAG: hypothetical protein D4R49_00735 [bacterium]